MTDIEAMLKAQEGTGPMKHGRFYPYVDTVGKITIGYGHNLSDKGMDALEIEGKFRNDIADAIEAVRHNCSVYDQLSRPRQMVLVSMAFNLGQEGLGKFVHFLSALHLGHYDEAATELLDSKAAKQAPVRYQQLASMMRDNVSQWV
jgi:lysozyme